MVIFKLQLCTEQKFNTLIIIHLQKIHPKKKKERPYRAALVYNKSKLTVSAL